MKKANKRVNEIKKPMQIKNAIKAFLLLFTMLLVWGSANVLFSRRENTADFYWIWFGSKTIFEQASPYSKEATAELQKKLSGSEIAPDQYQHSFPFPAFCAFILFPFGLLPYSTAYQFWRNIQFPMLFAGLYLMKRFLEFDLPWTQNHFLFFAGSIGFLYPIIAYEMGQVSIFIFFLFGFLLYSSQRKKAIFSGACLAFIAIRPDMFVLAAITLIIIQWNKWQFLLRTGLYVFVLLLALNLATLPLIGVWYFDWLKIIQEYSAHNPYAHYPIEILSNPTSQISVAVAITLYLAWQILQFIKEPNDSKKLLLASSLIITYSVANKLTGTYHLTLLLIPALILLRFYSKSKMGWLVWITMFSPWIFWFIPFNTIDNQRLGSLVVPLVFLSLQIIYSVSLSLNKQSSLQPL